MVRFIGYHDASEPIFRPGDLLGIAEIEPDGIFRCFLIDWRGRVVSAVGDTIFAEEVMLVPAPPMPLRRFPPPWGALDNEEDDPLRIWTGCPIGTA
jgi:hypothetical protein